MNRRWLLALLPALLLLGACGQSPQEEAFVHALQAKDWPNPEGDIDKGHQVCDILAGKTVDERYTAQGFLILHGFHYPVVKAASDHLCPLA